MKPFTKAWVRLGGMAAVVVCSMLCGNNAYAQRKTDPLDRGLVAVQLQSGVFVSWRVQAEEYYDVTYNLYRNGTLIVQGLTVSNYTDASGSSSSTYTVAPVINGVVKSQCAAVTPWNTGRTSSAPAYMHFPVADVVDRNHNVVWSQAQGAISQNYVINDISLGDVDGDGKIDFIVKRFNQTDEDNLYPVNNYTAYNRIEVYGSKSNYNLIWHIDCGPNMVSGADKQWDAVAFDWDQDGKCEIVMRGADNMRIYRGNGLGAYYVGDGNVNTRNTVSHVANMHFTNSGNEYLLYLDGETGNPYQVVSYPLPRANARDWGDSYGHRSSKYFIGAPYLNGSTPSLFLARGIYTKTEMVAYDINPSNHTFTNERRWHSYNNSGWYGQGNHNFAIADVDEDGCDEIIYGSMVVDNNFHGLSTTSLGHGDASHTGDLDPFRKGLETFACNEEKPCNNYRNATTCEIYYRTQGSGDDGRCMAGNFTNDYPGSIGMSTGSGVIALSAATPVEISGLSNNWNGQTPFPAALNFRIYWDGDLLEETINGPGSKEADLFIDKWGGRIMQTSGCATINWTKKNPCATGDIIGDWREEVIMRSADNKEIRVYTTTTPTQYRIPSLWYDKQYRQAMVWQSEGYNQPPHTSFFLGELEGYTQAPPPYTFNDRTIVGNGGVITSAQNGKQVLVNTTGGGQVISVGIGANASPSSLFIHSRTTVSGKDTKYGAFDKQWDHVLLGTGSNAYGLTGSTNLVKQGDGSVKLATTTFNHTGKTDIWEGAVIFYGDMPNSDIWMNHFTEFYAGGSYKSLSMEYGSMLYPCTHSIDKPVNNNTGNGTVNINNLTLKEGSRVVFDLGGDRLNIGSLFVRKQNWQYGPQYLAPVFEIRSNSSIADGDYLLGSLQEMAEGSASLLDVNVICQTRVAGHFGTLFFNRADKKYYLHVGTAIDADYQIDNSIYLDVLTQNFEDEDWMDNWSIVLGNRLTAVQQSNGASGSKCIWLKSVLDANNGTSATYTIPTIDEYENTSVYTFEYDFAQTSIIGSNADRAGEVILRDRNNNTIVTFRAFTGATSGEVVVGGNVVGTYSVTKGTYFKNETAPTISHHVMLRSSSSGTTLYLDGIAISISSNFVRVGSILYNTNRYAGQMQFDNIKLNCKIDGAYEVAITNGGFDANNNTGWDGTGFIFQSYTDAEHYNKTFDTHQTVYGLDNGWYILTVNGFYRNGVNDDTTSKLATLYANDAAIPVRLRSSIGLTDLQTATGLTAYPNNMRDAETAFLAGLYGNMLKVYVSDGTLTFGVRKSVAKTYDWAIFDDFRLFYLGSSASSVASRGFDMNDDVTEIVGTECATPVPIAYMTFDGHRVAVPKSGQLYIVKMSDGSTVKRKY